MLVVYSCTAFHMVRSYIGGYRRWSEVWSSDLAPPPGFWFCSKNYFRITACLFAVHVRQSAVCSADSNWKVRHRGVHIQYVDWFCFSSVCFQMIGFHPGIVVSLTFSDRSERWRKEKKRKVVCYQLFSTERRFQIWSVSLVIWEQDWTESWALRNSSNEGRNLNSSGYMAGSNV